MNYREDEKQLVERVIIENTPFIGVKSEKGWFLAMGRYKISEEYPSFEALCDSIRQVNWQVISTVCSIMFEELTKNSK